MTKNLKLFLLTLFLVFSFECRTRKEKFIEKGLPSSSQPRLRKILGKIEIQVADRKIATRLRSLKNLFRQGQYVDASFEKKLQAEAEEILHHEGFTAALVKIEAIDYIDYKGQETTSFTVNVYPGEQLKFGQIIFPEGNLQLSTKIKHLLTFGPGDPFSSTELSHSLTRLHSSQLFKNVTIEPLIEKIENRACPVKVEVEPNQDRNFRLKTGLNFSPSGQSEKFLKPNFSVISNLSISNQLTNTDSAEFEYGVASDFHGIKGQYRAIEPIGLPLQFCLFGSSKTDVNHRQICGKVRVIKEFETGTTLSAGIGQESFRELHGPDKPHEPWLDYQFLEVGTTFNRLSRPWHNRNGFLLELASKFAGTRNNSMPKICAIEAKNYMFVPIREIGTFGIFFNFGFDLKPPIPKPTPDQRWMHQQIYWGAALDNYRPNLLSPGEQITEERLAQAKKELKQNLGMDDEDQSLMKNCLSSLSDFCSGDTLADIRTIKKRDELHFDLGLELRTKIYKNLSAVLYDNLSYKQFIGWCNASGVGFRIKTPIGNFVLDMAIKWNTSITNPRDMLAWRLALVQDG